jgi:hypothetical protein
MCIGQLIRLFVTIILALALPSTRAVAQGACIEDPREVKLGGDGGSVRLKSYLCRTGTGSEAAQVRVEMHKFSEIASSLLVTNGQAKFLARAIGKPTVLENDVSKAYAALLKQFGETADWPQYCAETSTIININGAEPMKKDGFKDCEVIEKKTIRTITNATEEFNGREYPNVADATALLKKTIPDGLSFFYNIHCKDEKFGSSIPTTCKKFDKPEIHFWRSVKVSDAVDFTRNRDAYNRAVHPNWKTQRKSIDGLVGRDLALLRHISGDEWPEDFYVLHGTYTEPQECGDVKWVPGYKGWTFSYGAREAQLEAIILSNPGPRPINIGKLLGTSPDKTRLRVAETEGATGERGLLPLQRILAPRETILVPTRIVFPPGGNERAFEYPDTQTQAFTKYGKLGFRGGPSGPAGPSTRTFAYGPELNVAGLEIDNTRVPFSAGAANFLAITVSGGAGSCPYLLSRANARSEWVNHGKVLDKAPRKALAYTEARTFRGFRSQFRLEEREPEIALINAARLHVTLKNGGKLLLLPDNAGWTRGSGKPVRLLFDEAVDIAFHLPNSVRARDVVRSRLEVTGYYRRYASLVRRPPARAPLSLMPAKTIRSTWVPHLVRLSSIARSCGMPPLTALR